MILKSSILVQGMTLGYPRMTLGYPRMTLGYPRERWYGL